MICIVSHRMLWKKETKRWLKYWLRIYKIGIRQLGVGERDDVCIDKLHMIQEENFMSHRMILLKWAYTSVERIMINAQRVVIFAWSGWNNHTDKGIVMQRCIYVDYVASHDRRERNIKRGEFVKWGFIGYGLYEQISEFIEMYVAIGYIGQQSLPLFISMGKNGGISSHREYVNIA